MLEGETLIGSSGEAIAPESEHARDPYLCKVGGEPAWLHNGRDAEPEVLLVSLSSISGKVAAAYR